MVERREGTSTGEDITHSFADDNVERGEPGVDYIKRRPTYPIGDNPRGREIKFNATAEEQEYYGSKNPIFRGYRGQAPLEGQKYNDPVRVGKLPNINDIRPELPDRSVKTEALDAAKVIERASLEASDFRTLFPFVSIHTPSPGQTFSPGQSITIRAEVGALRFITSATLFIDGRPVDRRVVDRRDQEVSSNKEFIFIYNIPNDRVLGPMDITVRGFNINSSNQGFIADDARNNPPQADSIDIALGTSDGRLGQSHGSQVNAPMLEQTFIQRTPEGVSSLTVNIV